MSDECRWVEAHLLDALTGASAALARIDAHARACEECAASSERARRIVSGLEAGRASDAETERAAERVWRRLDAELDAPRRSGFLWLGGATLAAAVLAALAFAWLPLRRLGPPAAPVELAEVVRRAGAVTVAGASHLEQRRLAAGDVIQTARGGQIDLTASGIGVRVLGDSALRLDELHAERLAFTVTAGAAWFDVPPGRPGAVVVNSPAGRVEVTGTLFRVAAKDVLCARGSVRVRRDDGRVLAVRRGEAVAAGEVSPRTVPSAVLEAAQSELEAFSARAEAGTLIVRGEPPGARVFLDDAPVGNAPLFLRRPPGSVRYRVALGDESAEGSVVVDAGATRHVTYDLAPADSAEPPSQRRAQRSGAGFEQLLAGEDCRGAFRAARALAAPRSDIAESAARAAECAFAAGDYESALDMYSTIAEAYAGTPAAETAAFERARLAERLGRTKEALRALESYVRRHPRGALAADARFKLCNLLVAGEDTARAIDCLRDYRAQHPRGEHVAAALFIEATLERDRLDDCGRAAELFEQYLRLGTDRLEDAAYGAVRCWHEVDGARFERAARDYLHRFPQGRHAAAVRDLLGR